MRAFGPVVRQPATGRHSASVLLLHGLGDTADGWAPVGPQLNLPHVRFIYPTAPTRPITVNMGMRMPGGWVGGRCRGREGGRQGEGAQKGGMRAVAAAPRNHPPTHPSCSHTPPTHKAGLTSPTWTSRG